jgi:hypothetical protein
MVVRILLPYADVGMVVRPVAEIDADVRAVSPVVPSVMPSVLVAMIAASASVSRLEPESFGRQGCASHQRDHPDGEGHAPCPRFGHFDEPDSIAINPIDPTMIPAIPSAKFLPLPISVSFFPYRDYTSAKRLILLGNLTDWRIPSGLCR